MARTVTWAAGLALAAALIGELLAGAGVRILFGHRYGPSATVLRILLPGTVALSVQSIISSYVASRGRPRLVFVAWLCGALFGIAADLIVVPSWGIDGAAIVSVAAYALVLGIHLWILRRFLPAHADETRA